MNTAFWTKLAQKADRVFNNPGTTYPWEQVVLGAPVRRPGGAIQRMMAVAPNTWRGHRRIDKNRPGAGQVFQEYFLTRKRELLDGLSAVNNREQLHAYLNEVCDEIRSRLTNIVKEVRTSYNSIRKPVDLYIEHLLTMADEVPAELRQRLVPMLFLPLDKIMLQPIQVADGTIVQLFDPVVLQRYQLTPQSSYGHIRTERAYKELQRQVDQKAANVSNRCGRPFPPIYFDLLWNERYAREGTNLFELNP